MYSAKNRLESLIAKMQAKFLERDYDLYSLWTLSRIGIILWIGLSDLGNDRITLVMNMIKRFMIWPNGHTPPWNKACLTGEINQVEHTLFSNIWKFGKACFTGKTLRSHKLEVCHKKIFENWKYHD